jgi:hypothetical protein
MRETKQGVSQRQYAKQAGCSAAYIQKLISQGKLPVLQDGTLDPDACDAARAKFTRVGRGKRRWERRHGTRRTPLGLMFRRVTCSGCGESVRVSDNQMCDSPDPERFCTPKCAEDVAAGLTRAQIRQKIARGE